MTKLFYLTVVTVLLIELTACEQQSNNNQKPINKTEENLNVSNTNIELGENELREFGKIIKIEEGIYPMYVVTVALSDKNQTRSFNLNIEAIALTAEDISQFSDKQVMLHYTTILETNLLDLKLNGASIMGRKEQKNAPNSKEFTGQLKGATAITPGDLPGNISLIDKNGKIELFSCFVSPEMVNINEQEVTAVYNERGVETITYIQLSEN